MKQSLLASLLLLTTCCVPAPGAPILSCPFEDGATQKLRGCYHEGKGTVGVEDGAGRDGGRALHLSGQSPDAKAFLQSDELTLTPGKLYDLSYWVKKDQSSITLGFYISYISKGDTALTEHIAFALAPKNFPEPSGWSHFGPERQSLHMFYEPIPKGAPRKYRSAEGGAFSFPPERFGNALVNCRIKVMTTGIGNLWLDDIMLEELPASGLEAAEAAEAKRLLLGKARLDGATANAKDDPSKLVIYGPLPLPKDYARSEGRYPASATNVSIKGNVFVRDGAKPVFLLGCEFLSPQMCKLLGLDFFVVSSFMAPPNASRNADGDLVVSFGDYPMLDEIIDSRLRAGVMVWVDMLQGWKRWQSELLLKSKPSVFIDRDGFFTWRQDNPEGRSIRYNNWATVIKRARKYPIFAYELFNEVSYMDYSPHNLARFRALMEEKYHSLGRANQAWGTNFASFAAVVPPGEEGNGKLPDGKIHLQLRADWLAFIGQRFGEIAKECHGWVGAQDPRPLKVIQAYWEPLFNKIDPAEKIKGEDAFCSEEGGGFFAQFKGADDEREILASMRFESNLDLLGAVSRDKPIIDGECSTGNNTKPVTSGTTLLDLKGKWRFSPAVPGDAWRKPAFDDSAWARLDVPGMWGNQGFANCNSGLYRKTFQLGDKGGEVYLCGEELADKAEIYVNGEHVKTTSVWNERFSLNIEKWLRDNASNTIAIQISNNYFKQGFYWGGIRGGILLAKSPSTDTPFSAGQMQTFLWQRALHGQSGLCLSYFYMTEAFKDGPALLNPRLYAPESIVAMAEAKERINNMGELLLRRPNDAARVALLNSISSDRAYLPDNPFLLPSAYKWGKDFSRAFGGLTFAQAPFRTVSDRDIPAIGDGQFKALVLANAARMSRENLGRLEDFVKAGGLLIVDGVSLSCDDFDGSPLDASGLLGATRAPLSDNAPDSVCFDGFGLRRNFVVIQPDSHEPKAWELLAPGDGVTPLATDTKGRVFACARNLGKGKVVTVAAELSASDLKEVYRAALADAGIAPALKMDGDAPYIETHRLAHAGRELWCLLNWGAESTVRVAPAKTLAPGLYRLRDAVENAELKGPERDGLWSERDLDAGVELPMRNEKPLALLVEPTGVAPLEIGGLPDARRRMLDKFWQPLWQPVAKPPNGRILWLGKTNRTPAVYPAAAAVARACGYGVDILDDAKFAKQVAVLRGTQEIQGKLGDYKTLIIPHTTQYGIDESQAWLLTDYVSNGGSLLLLGVQTYGIHSMNYWQGKFLPKLIGAEIATDAITDSANCRFNEPRCFNTSQLEPHPVTAGIKQFNSFGCAPVIVTSPKEWTTLVSKGKKTVLAVRSYGKGRIAIMGDVDWLTIDGLQCGDNPALLANLLAWLGGAPPLAPETARQAAVIEGLP